MTTGMRPFGLIGTSLWQSDKFNSLQNLDARLAYIWLHTSSKTCAGAMRLGPAHLAEELEFVSDLERAQQIFRELAAADLISWIKPYVVISRYLAFNPVKSWRHAVGAFNEVLAMPDCEAKKSLMKSLQKQPGAMKLAEWRDKTGDPHEVLVSISVYLSENDEHSEPYPNPSDTHQIPIGNPTDRVAKPIGTPSGKSKSKIYKGEMRTHADVLSLPSTDNTTQVATEEVLRKMVSPSRSTLNSSLAISARRA